MPSTIANATAIVPLTAADIPSVAETFAASYNAPPWNYDWIIEDAIMYLNEYVDSPGFNGFLIRDGERVVAALLGREKTWWTGRQFYVDELFVAPNIQGKGYGKALLQHVEEYSRTKGIERVMLMTNKYMPALQFYLKNDFTKVEQYVYLFKQV